MTNDQIIMMLISLDLGILPPDGNASSRMKMLSSELSRSMKRKFRKLWKKALEDERKNLTDAQKRALDVRVGLKVPKPTSTHLIERRFIVRNYILRLIGERRESK